MQGYVVRAAAALISVMSLVMVPMAQAAGATTIILQNGHSTILATPGLARVAVGDAKIAGAVPVGSNELVINAKAPGHTSIHVWDAAGERSYEITVTPQDLDDVSSVLRSMIDVRGVTVADFGHAIVIRGSVEDNAHFSQISDIVARFVPYAKQEGYSIVNAVVVNHPYGELQTQLSSLPGVENVRLDSDASGDVILSGRVHDQAQAELLVARAQGLAGPYLPPTGKVINRLEVETTSQIDVKIYVLEIDKTALTQLGVRLQGATVDPNNPNNFIFGDPNFPVIEGPASNSVGKALNVGAFFRITRLAPTLDVIERTGHARLLSAPDLVTLPGNEAKFLVGGQIPYVYTTGLGETSVIFKDYGVQFTVTPTILSNGAIESKVNPEISTLDFQHAVSIQGTLVPALLTDRLQTDVVTRSGEGIIMGGMVQRIDQQNLDKLPGLGDLPILGPLFRSTRYQKQDTDVVFIVVPEVITL